MVFRWITCVAGLGLAFVGLSLKAQERPQTLGTHMMIADPASLSGARAEAVYQSIKDTLRRQYMKSGDPVTAAFQRLAAAKSRADPFWCSWSALRQSLRQ